MWPVENFDFRDENYQSLAIFRSFPYWREIPPNGWVFSWVIINLSSKSLGVGCRQKYKTNYSVLQNQEEPKKLCLKDFFSNLEYPKMHLGCFLKKMKKKIKCAKCFGDYTCWSQPRPALQDCGVAYLTQTFCWHTPSFSSLLCLLCFAHLEIALGSPFLLSRQ